MSFIYEALKRAEDDNQQRVTARVRSNGGTTRFRGRSRRWVWALIAVLGANALVVGAWIVVRSRQSPVVVAARTESPTPKPVQTVVPAQDPIPTPPRAATSSSVTAPSARSVEPRPAPSATPSPPAPRAAVERRAERGTLVTPSPPARPPAPVERPSPPVAPVDALAITLQVLVYSEIPAQRMVFIDGRRYTEGDAIDAETVVERINPDGAVVRRRGQRFSIPDRRP